jgi:hypothetical protein
MARPARPQFRSDRDPIAIRSESGIRCANSDPPPKGEWIGINGIGSESATLPQGRGYDTAPDPGRAPSDAMDREEISAGRDLQPLTELAQQGRREPGGVSMEDQLVDGAARAALPVADPTGGPDADLRTSGRTSHGGPDFGAALDRLVPHLVRFEVGPRLVVVELEVRGRRVGLARPVPEGEHDVLAIAIAVLDDAEGLLPALVRDLPLRCA